VLPTKYRHTQKIWHKLSRKKTWSKKNRYQFKKNWNFQIETRPATIRKKSCAGSQRSVAYSGREVINQTFNIPMKIISTEKKSQDDLSKILLETAYKQTNPNKYDNLNMFLNNKKGVFDTATYSNSSAVSPSESSDI